MITVKKSLLAVLAILVPAFSFARFVKQDKALQIAQSFMTEKSTRAASAPVELEMIWPIPSAATRAVSIPSYYIFNKSDGTGFVIVSAESETPEILAYSNEGSFQLDQVDKGAEAFLNCYEDGISKIRQGASALKATDFGTGVLLQTMNWNQSGTYFNYKYAPQQYATNCPSGCVATAMAIIMRYHCWPPKATGGTHSYYCESLDRYLSFNYDNTTFDWDIPEYPYGAKSDEISKIHKACGVALNMEYGAYSSGCQQEVVAYALPKYFYYEKPFNVFRDLFSADEWAMIMKKEIDEGRPVMAGGVSEQYGGHSFVLDGYNRYGMFHYNLGWQGTNNGYYVESLVSEEKYAIRSSVVGIKPRPLDVEYSGSPYLYGSVELRPEGNIVGNNCFWVCFHNFGNISNDSTNALVRLDLYDKDDNFKFNVITFENNYASLVPGVYFYGWSYRTYIPKGKNVDSTDKLCLSTSTDGKKSWQLVTCDSQAMPIATLGGREKDAPKVSEISFQFNDEKFSIYPSVIQAGKLFNVSVTNFYNYDMNGYEGNVGLAICDTVTFKIKYLLKNYSINLQYNFGYNIMDFKDLKIPESIFKKLTATDAIMLVSKRKDESTYCPILNFDMTLKCLPMQDVTDVDLAVPATWSDEQPATIYTIDGRQADSRSKGLYLQKAADGTVRKVYYAQ